MRRHPSVGLACVCVAAIVAWDAIRGAHAMIDRCKQDWTALLQELIRIPSCFEAEHAIVLGGEPGHGAHRAVAAARDDPASGVERGDGESPQIVCVGGEVNLDVEVGAGERVSGARQLESGPAPSRGRIDDRSPGLR